MLRWGIVAVVATGCYRPAGLTGGGDCSTTCDTGCPSGLMCGSSDNLCHAMGTLDCSARPVIDAPGRDLDVADANPNCVGTGMFAPACIDPPGGPLHLAGDLETSGSTLCSPSVPDRCLITGTTITVASLHVFGFRTLVIVATEDLMIDGPIRANSTIGDALDLGPGAAAVPCTGATDGGSDASSGAGGGAGGGFQGPGGTGGNTTGGSSNAAISRPTQMRAGCAGTSGGAGTMGTVPGGAPGGGIAFVAPAIHVLANTTINASGMGGTGAKKLNGGGGGGGSGGLIVFDAGTTSFGSGVIIFANGGGGGAGIGNANATSDGGESVGGGVAVGGGALNGAGDGGAGANGGLQLSGINGSNGSSEGGGGGGGGAGWIIVLGNSTGAPVFSPPPQ